MIARNSDLKHVLVAATRLIENGRRDAGETVEVGQERFRVIAKHDDRYGWILVLLQQPIVYASDDALRDRYGLTDREIEVAYFLAERHTNKEIAEALGITESTAGRHTERVLRKLCLTTRRSVRCKLLQC